MNSIALREKVTSSDSQNPSIGTGVDLGGSDYARVMVEIAGTTPSARITFLVGDANAAAYFEQAKEIVTVNRSFIVNVSNCSDFNVKIDQISGEGATVNVYVMPVQVAEASIEQRVKDYDRYFEENCNSAVNIDGSTKTIVDTLDGRTRTTTIANYNTEEPTISVVWS